MISFFPLFAESNRILLNLEDNGNRRCILVTNNEVSVDEAKELSLELGKEMQARKFKDNNGKLEVNGADYRKYKPYYVIITDDYKMVRDIEIVKDVCEMPVNYGFSLIVISPRLINIPNECKAFISLGDKKSGIFENELVSNKQKEFLADFDPTLNMFECCKILANVPIDIAKENQSLPNALTFLEMYNVGMVEQLNILTCAQPEWAAFVVGKVAPLLKLDVTPLAAITFCKRSISIT